MARGRALRRHCPTAARRPCTGRSGGGAERGRGPAAVGRRARARRRCLPPRRAFLKTGGSARGSHGCHWNAAWISCSVAVWETRRTSLSARIVNGGVGRWLVRPPWRRTHRVSADIDESFPPDSPSRVTGIRTRLPTWRVRRRRGHLLDGHRVRPGRRRGHRHSGCSAGRPLTRTLGSVGPGAWGGGRARPGKEWHGTGHVQDLRPCTEACWPWPSCGRDDSVNGAPVRASLDGAWPRTLRRCRAHSLQGVPHDG